jgi:hypothetical protein
MLYCGGRGGLILSLTYLHHCSCWKRGCSKEARRQAASTAESRSHCVGWRAKALRSTAASHRCICRCSIDWWPYHRCRYGAASRMLARVAVPVLPMVVVLVVMFATDIPSALSFLLPTCSVSGSFTSSSVDSLYFLHYRRCSSCYSFPLCC